MACRVAAMSACLPFFQGPPAVLDLPVRSTPAGAASPDLLCCALSTAIGAVEALRLPSPSRAGSGGAACGGAASEELRRSLAQVHRALQAAAAAAAAAQPGVDAVAPCANASGCPKASAVSSSQLAEGRRLLAGLLEADVPARLVACIGALDFEARKDAMRLFTDLLRHALPLEAGEALVAYFASHPTIVQLLLEGCGRARVFAHCAEMLRDCARFPALVAALLEGGVAPRLIDLAGHPSFELSTEAFATLRELLLVHKEVAVRHVMSEFEAFFGLFHSSLLAAETDYVVKRQALRLLADVLLDRTFCEVMVQYVADERFLQIHMNALRDSSRSIQLGGFHIFKIFVANPSKPRKVHSILHRNKDGLLKMLSTFSAEAAQDGILHQDLMAVERVLRSLEAPSKRQSSGNGL